MTNHMIDQNSPSFTLYSFAVATCSLALATKQACRTNNRDCLPSSSQFALHEVCGRLEIAVTKLEKSAYPIADRLVAVKVPPCPAPASSSQERA